MGEKKFTKDKTLKHLEELIAKVVIWELHHEIMVMSSFQYIISSYEENDFLDEDFVFEYSKKSSGFHDFDEVRFQPANFSHDTFFLQFYYHDSVGAWLENFFMERYPLYSILHILNCVNGMTNGSILSIYYDYVIQL